MNGSIATIARAVLATLLLSACGSESANDTQDADSASGTVTQPLWDGSDAVRLQLTNGGGFVGRYYSFLQPLGFDYLVIDGKCRFWVNQDVWAGARAGTLTEDRVAALESELHWADLTDLAGNWENRGCMDGSTWQLSDGDSELTCYCGCTDDDVPSAVHDIGNASSDALLELWDAGAGFDAPMRIAAEDLTETVQLDGLEEDWQTWPLSWSISDAWFASTKSVHDPGAGAPVSEPADREALRALRDNYTAARAASGHSGASFETRVSCHNRTSRSARDRPGTPGTWTSPVWLIPPSSGRSHWRRI
jgi:hypothetical protein